MQSLPVRKKKNTGARAAPASDGKLEAAMENYGSLFDFYQKQTLNAAYWFIFLQITTLIGAALTPIMLLIPFPPGDTHAKLWQALPAAIGGLAAACNASFALRQEWIQSYATLSALESEYQLFTVRTSPYYSDDEANAIEAFQKRLTQITMTEVQAWKTRLSGLRGGGRQRKP